MSDLRFRIFLPQSYFRTNANAEFRINSMGAFFEVYGERIDLSYNKANLPYARATTAGSEVESLEANVCGSEENMNLTRKGILLLIWYQRLGHVSFRLIHSLSRQGYLLDGSVDQTSEIMCDSCRLAQAAKRPVDKSESSEGVPQRKKNEYNLIKGGDLFLGNRVSIDQYSSTPRGRLTTGFGKAPVNDIYGRGTMFVDHVSGCIRVEHQVSICASDTIAAKRRFERLLDDRSVTVCSYRADNGIFNAMEFEEEIKKAEQGITFSGLGAQHQNGVAERMICTVIERARTSLIRAAIRNSENIDTTLWPFSLNHACYVWNEVPKEGSFLPSQILSKSFSRETRDYTGYKIPTSVGCLVYILDYRVASGKKLP